MCIRQRMKLSEQRLNTVLPSLERALVGMVLGSNISVSPSQGGWNRQQDSNWSTSTGQDADAPAWCSFGNRGSGNRGKGKGSSSYSRIPEKAHFIPIPIHIPFQFHPHLFWWLKEENVLLRQSLLPLLSSYSDLYRYIK